MTYTNIRRFLLTLTLLGLSSAVGAQKMYKWVDEDGNVHYSDKVPPDQTDQAREQLNDQGVVIDRVDRAKTDEEYAAEEAARRAAAAAAEEVERQRREDDKMLAIYASEKDIVRIKDQKVAILERNVQTAGASIAGQTRGLAELLERAATIENQGVKVSEALVARIEDVRKEIRRQEDYIAQKEIEKVQILEDYERELARYREVWARRHSER